MLKAGQHNPSTANPVLSNEICMQYVNVGCSARPQVAFDCALPRLHFRLTIYRRCSVTSATVLSFQATDRLESPVQAASRTLYVGRFEDAGDLESNTSNRIAQKCKVYSSGGKAVISDRCVRDSFGCSN